MVCKTANNFTDDSAFHYLTTLHNSRAITKLNFWMTVKDELNKLWPL